MHVSYDDAIDTRFVTARQNEPKVKNQA